MYTEERLYEIFCESLKENTRKIILTRITEEQLFINKRAAEII